MKMKLIKIITKEINMFNFKLEIPTYKEWKASVEKYTGQVQKFYKDFWNDVWINFPPSDR